MKYFAETIGQFDCGTGALKIYLAQASKSKSYLFLDIYKEKASMLDLVQLAARYEITLKGYHGSADAFLKLKQSAIVHLKIENREHYMVFLRQYKNKLILIDPSYGKVETTKALFFAQFSGHYLLSHTPIQPLHQEVIRFHIPLFDILLLVGSQLSSAFALLFGLASFEVGKSVMLTISLLAIVGILTVLTRHQQVNIQARLLRKYVNPFLSIKSKDPFGQYQGMLLALTQYLKHVFTMIQGTIVSITLIILMFSLGYPMIISLFVIGVMLCFENLFDENSRQKQRDDHMHEYQLFNEAQSTVHLHERLTQFQKQLIKKVESRQFISYLSCILLFIFHLIWSALHQEIHLGQLLFNFFLSMTVYQQCHGIIPLFKRVDKLTTYQVLYLHYQRVKG